MTQKKEPRRVAARRAPGCVKSRVDRPEIRSADVPINSDTLSFAALDAATNGRFGVVDVACPACGPVHNPRRKVLRVWRREASFATFCCARCDVRGYAFDGAPGRPTTPEEREKLLREIDRRRALEREKEAGRIRHALRIWREAHLFGFRGTPGERYLVEHRGLDVRGLDLDHVLRWSPIQGALLALMSDAVTGEPCGVHRTFLDWSCRKLDRKMRGRKGVLRISADEAVSYGLGICEGVEDALAIILDGWRPVWSCGDRGGIGAFPILPGIDSLTVFSDAGAGEEEAQACARRWREAGRESVVALPPRRQPS